MKTPFIWLGAGRAKKWAVEEKGLLLDRAAQSGLPVPAGAILLDEFFRLLLAEGVVVLQNGRINVPSPAWLHETLYESVRFPRLDKLVAVRPAVGAVGQPQLNVNFNDPAHLARSLCQVYSLFTDQRRDILVMEMKDCEVRGTAVTNANQDHDTIYSNKAPESKTLPQLRRRRRPEADQPP